jgi:hypothetical protein
MILIATASVRRDLLIKLFWQIHLKFFGISSLNIVIDCLLHLQDIAFIIWLSEELAHTINTIVETHYLGNTIYCLETVVKIIFSVKISHAYLVSVSGQRDLRHTCT